MSRESFFRRNKGWIGRVFNLLFGVAIATGIGLWVLSGSREAPGPQEGAAAASGAPYSPGSLRPAPEPAGAPAEEPGPLPEVAILQSQSRELVYDFPLRGFTEAARRIDIRAQTSGLVTSESVPKGSRVEAGDVLCRIEQGDRPARLAQARARIAQAEADAKSARQLATEGYGSRTAAAAAETTQAAAFAEVQQIELDISRTVIRAPFSGALETSSAEPGSLLQPGSLCASILGLDPIRVVGFAPERTIDAFAEGTAATAELTGGQRREGVISFVSRAADPNTRTFRVELTIENPDYAVRDGLSAEILVPIRRAAAHLVPQSALTLSDDGVVGLRLVDENSTTFFAPVRLLRDTPEGFWVDQLPARANIVVIGQEFVGDGVMVDPRPVKEALAQ